MQYAHASTIISWTIHCYTNTMPETKQSYSHITLQHNHYHNC